MAQVIEFYTPSSFRPPVKWPPKEEQGKVIAFMSLRREAAAIVCAAYEELDSESSEWSESRVDEGTPVSHTCSIIFQTSGFGGQDVLFEQAEVRHVHLWGTVDTPFRRPIRVALLEEGLAEGHRWVLEFGMDNISHAQ